LHTCFIARSATSRSAQRISSADSHLNRSAISVSAVYQQKLDQLSDQLSSADSTDPSVTSADVTSKWARIKITFKIRIRFRDRVRVKNRVKGWL